MKNLNVITKNQKGISLVEVLAATAISFIGIMAISQVMQVNMQQQKRFEFKSEVFKLRNEMWNIVSNEADMAQIFNHPSNAGTAACLNPTSSIVCPTDWQDLKLFQVSIDNNTETVELSELPYTHDPTDSSTRGFTETGVACTTYGLDSRCRFRYVAQWKPNCPTACSNPSSVHVRATLEEIDDGKSKLDLNKDRFAVNGYYVMTPSKDRSLSLLTNTPCLTYENGTAVCWGQNNIGQLGRNIGSAPYRSEFPEFVVGLSGSGRLEGVKKIVDGVTTLCALLKSGRVTCWAENHHGGIGIGSLPTVHGGTAPKIALHPVDFVMNDTGTGPLEHIVDITPLEHGMCAVNRDKEVFCWGELMREATICKVNKNTGLSSSYAENVTTPFDDLSGGAPYNEPYHFLYSYAQKIVSATKAELEGAGGPHPSVSTGGTNILGGWVVDAAGCTMPASFDKFVSGPRTKCFLIGGEANCWGYDSEGQLGVAGPAYPARYFMNSDYFIPRVGTTNPSFTTPVPPANRLTGIVDLALGTNTNCAIVNGTDNGEVVCWGAQASSIESPRLQGLMGDGRSGDAVAQPPANVLDETGTANLTGIKAVRGSWTHFCALRSNGDVLCWGSNKHGQIGNSTLGIGGSALYPRKADMPEPAIEIAVGEHITCAIGTSKKTYCWGFNGHRGLGVDPISNAAYPVAASATPLEVGGLPY